MTSHSASSAKPVAAPENASSRLDSANSASPAMMIGAACDAVGQPAADRDRDRERDAGRREQIAGLGGAVVRDVLREHRHEVRAAEEPDAVGERDDRRAGERAVAKEADRQQRRAARAFPSR